MVIRAPNPPQHFDVLYRAVDKPEYAEDFANGRVWITTVQQCRATEDAQRRDTGEMPTLYYFGGTVTGDPHDPAFREIAQRQVGPFTPGPSARHWTFSNNTVRTSVLNAFLLCTSPYPNAVSPKFGSHLIRINQPHEFLIALSLALHAERRTLQYGIVGRVKYEWEYAGPRTYQGLDPEPDQAFGKPVRYEDEREVRMVWSMVNPRQKPFLLNCPQARDFVTRLS
jgi:hypothetical protein